MLSHAPAISQWTKHCARCHIPLYRRDKIRVRYIYIWVKQSPAGQQYPEYLLNRDVTRSLARSTDWQGTFERAKFLVWY